MFQIGAKTISSSSIKEEMTSYEKPKLLIQFDAPMNQASVAKNISIYPQVQFTSHWTDDENLELIIDDLIAKETNFLVNVFDSALTSSGEKLEKPYSKTFKVDGDGIVQVSAKDEDTGEIQSIEIVASSGLTDTEIDDLLRENFTLSEQKERISGVRGRSGEELSEGSDSEFDRALEELRRAIYVYQWRLDSEGQNFKGVGRQTMENCLDDARAALENPKDIDQLKNSLTALSMVVALFERFLEQ